MLLHIIRQLCSLLHHYYFHDCLCWSSLTCVSTLVVSVAVGEGLTGDVAVVVGAVVVLQEGHQRVQEVMGTQQDQLLQNIWRGNRITQELLVTSHFTYNRYYSLE